MVRDAASSVILNVTSGRWRLVATASFPRRTEILALGGLSDVFSGLPQAFKDNLAGWRKVYDSETPQSVGYPAPFDALSGLQNLCVLRVIRRDKLMDGVQKFVEDEMGRRYTEPPPFDLPACQ